MGTKEFWRNQSPFLEIQAINFKGRQRLWLVEVILLPAVSGLDRESLNRILQTH